MRQAQWFHPAAVLLLMASSSLYAQTQVRRAAISGERSSGAGKCTIEVVVDGVAEVEVRGDNGVLRNLTGQLPQWRRFQCNMAMPLNPVGFRFEGVDGRGRQTLVRDPRDSGSAVVRIEDDKAGSEGYTFDLIWDGGVAPGVDRDRNFSGEADRGFPRQGGGRESTSRFTPDEAIRACEDAIVDEAIKRLRTGVIALRGTSLDNNARNRDSITGVFDSRRGRDWDRYRFACAVDFNTGRIVSVDFTPIGPRR